MRLVAGLSLGNMMIWRKKSVKFVFKHSKAAIRRQMAFTNTTPKQSTTSILCISALGTWVTPPSSNSPH